MKNNQLRPTAIRGMVKAGFDDRFIQTVTNHKVPHSLRHYDPEPEMTRRYDASKAIMTVRKPNPRFEMGTETRITKKVSKTSIHTETVTFEQGTILSYS